MYTLLYRSANHSFYWFSARANNKNIYQWKSNGSRRTADNDGRRWRVESDAMAIVALVALIQDNHHREGGENSVQKYIGKRIGNRAYRVVSQSSVLLSRVNEWEPDNTEYVWHAVVSSRCFWLPYVFVLYTSLGIIKIFWLIAAEFLQRRQKEVNEFESD